MAENMDLEINLIGSDQTGNSFSSMDAALSDLQKLANDVSASFADFAKSISGSMSDAARAAEDMVAPLQNDQAELEALIQSMGDVDRTAQSMGEAFNTAGREIQASLNNAAEGTRTLSDGMNGARDSVQGASDQTLNMGNNVDKLGQALSAEMIGEQLKSIGETGLKVFEEASSAAADFEFNISRIGAVLTTSGKATSAQMDQMSQDALKIGSSSSFSANEVADGMYTLARQGLDASTIMGDGVNGAINIVNDLAQATDSAMNDTATVVTDVVHEYGLSGDQLRSVANTISGALHNSSETLDDYYQSMKQVGPVASAMHQSAMDVSTALAIMAQHGVTGSSAGTTLKNMFLGLEPHTKKAAELMKELGISSKDGAADSFYQLNGNLKPMPDILQILNDKFGGLNDKQKELALSTTFTKYGLSGLNTIVTQNKDSFKQWQDELKKDDAATIAAKKLDNLHGDMLKFHAGMQTMMKSFGDSVNGMLRPMVQGLSNFVKQITELPKPVKEAAMIVLGLGSALAVAGGSVIAFAGGVKMLGPAMSMAGFSSAGLEAAAAGLGAIFSEILIPIALIVAAVAAVGLAFKLAYDHIKPFHDAINNAINSVKEITGALEGLWKGGAAEGKGISILDSMGFNSTEISAIQNVFARIKEGIAATKVAFNNVKSAVDGIFMVLTGSGDGKGISILEKMGFNKSTIKDLEAMGGTFKSIFDAIKNSVTNAMNGISGVVRPIIDGLLAFWNDHQYQFRQICEAAWKAIGSTVVGAVSNLINTIGPAISTIWQWWQQYWPEIKQLFSEVWNGIVWILTPAINGMIVIISTALGFISGAWSGAWGAIKDIFKFQWDLIVGVLKIAWSWISGIVSVGLDVMTGNFSKAGDDLKSTFTNTWDNIKSTFGNLIKDFGDFGKNIMDGLAGGISGAIDGAVNAIENVADSLVTKFKKALGINSPSRLFMQMGGHILDGLVNGLTNGNLLDLGKAVFKDFGGGIMNTVDKIKGFLSGAFSGGASGSVGSWLAQAMSIAGVPQSWAGALSQIIQHESGGNPNAVNNWDSNAKAGHASQGLMQLIPSTFAAYSVQGLGGIDNPIANIVAGIKYIQSRYGGIMNVPGIQSLMSGGSYVGYASGTDFAVGGWSLVGERGPELMYVPRGAQIKTASETSSIFRNANQTAALPSGSSGGIVYNITVHANGNITRNEQELADVVSRGILQKVKLQGKI